MADDKDTRTVYRHAAMTRLTHWSWAIALFFLLMSGLQIFMARPDLYIGRQSGFEFDNTVLSIGAVVESGQLRGVTEILGHRFDTTGWLGVVDEAGRMTAKSFPSWMTIPSYRDLATGRIVHFFFAWVLVAALVLWLLSSLLNKHLWRDIVPRTDDARALPQDIADHARLRLHHRRAYGPLQKLSYALILLVALPLMIATGLTMSPGVNAMVPFLADLFGGRQSARTLHFAIMLVLVAFFVVHIVMVVLAGPLNELRSMITGWYRTDGDRT